MLQLTFHAELPSPALVQLVHDSYMTLRSCGERAGCRSCLSVTLTDLGATESIRYRALFEHVGSPDGGIRVVTEAADAQAAMRSGFSVLLGSRRRALQRTHEAPTYGTPPGSAPSRAVGE